MSDISPRAARTRRKIAGAGVRAAAARTVVRVFAGESLDQALSVRPESGAVSSEHDRALLQALAYGVMRHHRLLTTLCEKILDRRQKTSSEVLALIEVGLFQLRSMRIPPHAAVSATVDACTQLGQTHARSLVNAILRRYQRDRISLEGVLLETPAVRYSWPDWLADVVRVEWTTQWQQILATSSTLPPMTLRVNKRRVSLRCMHERLMRSGVKAFPVPMAPSALRLARPCPISRVPGFIDGCVSVQDASAQLAAPLLDAHPGMRVLDACSAPGGKTAHLLELTANLDLVALDINGQRQTRTKENLERLGLTATLARGDAAQPDEWWDGRLFERILLDAPCSGTGVIRRHPDIKWLRRRSDIRALAGRQLNLLDALWPLLAPRGTLLYATCSILNAENVSVIAKFLQSHPDAIDQPIEVEWGQRMGAGRRLPPGGEYDGFYFARLTKRPSVRSTIAKRTRRPTNLRGLGRQSSRDSGVRDAVSEEMPSLKPPVHADSTSKEKR